MSNEKISPIEKRARHISYKQRRPWYVCRRRGCSDVMVSERDVKRYMKIGYEPMCVFYRGLRCDTIYMVGDEVRFVISEEDLRAHSGGAGLSGKAA